MLKHDRRSWLTWLALGVTFGAACTASDRNFEPPEGLAGGAGSSAGQDGAEAGKPPTQAGGAGGESPSSAAGEAGEPGVSEPCGNSPCLNGGTCAVSGTVFTCDCADGFEGERCETNIDDCSPNPCANAGKCRDGVASFSCDCTGGLAGDTCELFLFEPLPLLPNADSCRLEALSGDGSVAVGSCSDSEGTRAFWWKRALGTKALPAEGAVTQALGVSRDGTVVVGRQQVLGQPSVGARWVDGQFGESYPGFVYEEGQTSASAVAVADDGLTLFGKGEASNSAPRGISWENGLPVLLGSSGGEIYALAASGDGKVVAGYSHDPSSAIRWTLSTGWIRLPTLAQERGIGRGLSRDGNVVVGAAGEQAVRWIGTDDPELLGIPGTGEDANEDGSVIVGSSGGAAMVWTETDGARLVADVLLELHPLAAQGWTLLSADVVSADGKTIGGSGKLTGNERAWIARLP